MILAGTLDDGMTKQAVRTHHQVRPKVISNNHSQFTVAQLMQPTLNPLKGLPGEAKRIYAFGKPLKHQDRD